MANLSQSPRQDNPEPRKAVNPARRKPRTEETAAIEGDLIATIRNAARFADLAEGHYEIFDEAGVEYCIERFLDHARLAATHLKRWRRDREGIG